MRKEQLLILDCHGEVRPAICFNLEIADYQMRMVKNEDEALNLLDNARSTGERYFALLVNNPYLNVDMTKLVDDIQKIEPELPVIFVKDSTNLKKIVKDISLEKRTSPVFHAEPTSVVELLARLSGDPERKRQNGPFVERAM